MAIGVDRALSTVGVRVDELIRAGGAVLEAGDAYLVGSLAQGFGNRGSDIDIHLFAADVTAPTAPYLFFLDNTPVDVEHLPVDFANVLISALGTDVLETSAGIVALVPAPSRQIRKLLTRWFTAIPLRSGQRAVLSEADRVRVLPHILRGTLETVLLAAAVAHVAGAAGHNADYLWYRCRQAVLDLLCTARGHVPTGAKWLSSRVDQALPDAERRRVSRIGSIADLHGDPGFVAGVDPLAVVRLRHDDDLRPQAIGRTRFLLTRHGRLEARRPLVEGTLRESLPGNESQALGQLRAGMVRLEIDRDALEGMLHDAAH